jgi:probable poly-beta-1,6-N-acetyl-D-glucosamine export protein
MSPTREDQYAGSLLRGVAILAVIVIHLLSSLPHRYSQSTDGWRVYVAIDQLARFCVPLFVALSGYGFWEKYATASLQIWPFLKRQISKLLPLYLIASCVYYTVFLLKPEWSDPSVTRSLPLQILTGRADYQLYFVPMIFQFYLLFPILRKLVQKFRWTSLLAAGIFQLTFYYLLSTQSLPSFLLNFFSNDQKTYVWFFTWIFYFILGMHIKDIITWVKQYILHFYVLTLAVIVSYAIDYENAISQLLSGIDPLVALQSTRIQMMIYATFVTIFLFAVSSMMSKRGKDITSWVAKVGDSSYPIYLFHTLILRVLLFL